MPELVGAKNFPGEMQSWGPQELGQGEDGVMQGPPVMEQAMLNGHLWGTEDTWVSQWPLPLSPAAEQAAEQDVLRRDTAGKVWQKWQSRAVTA